MGKKSRKREEEKDLKVAASLKQRPFSNSKDYSQEMSRTEVLFQDFHKKTTKAASANPSLIFTMGIVKARQTTFKK